MYSNQEDFIYN